MKNLYVFVKQFIICLNHIKLVIATMFLLLFCGAVTISFLEEMSLGRSVYFTFITALAVGYGDITPITTPGKIVSVLIGIIGLIFFGIITGISTRSILYLMHPDKFEKMKD